MLNDSPLKPSPVLGESFKLYPKIGESLRLCPNPWLSPNLGDPLLNAVLSKWPRLLQLSGVMLQTSGNFRQWGVGTHYAYVVATPEKWLNLGSCDCRVEVNRGVRKWTVARSTRWLVPKRLMEERR